jgi:glycosyltransferase involved in cell wall biosynthesis
MTDETAVQDPPRHADDMLPASVIIPAFTLDRWDYLQNAVASVQAQAVPPMEIIVVVDHSSSLLAHASRELRDVKVIPNTGARGSSGARNSGAAAAQGDVLVFLDDDIVACEHWLEAMLRHFAKADVIGVGGHTGVLRDDSLPPWFPQEFNWTIGASYVGMPEHMTPVRNVWSCNMAIRRSVFEAIGGFRADLGKIDKRVRPEDTELCLRATAKAKGIWVYEPTGRVNHRVPRERVKLTYFLYRCFCEGSGKATLIRLSGLRLSTSLERDYVMCVLPSAVACGAAGMVRGDRWAGMRSLAIIIGFCFAMIGFLVAGSVNILLIPAGWWHRRNSIATAEDLGEIDSSIDGHVHVMTDG